MVNGQEWHHGNDLLLFSVTLFVRETIIPNPGHLFDYLLPARLVSHMTWKSLGKSSGGGRGDVNIKESMVREEENDILNHDS